MKKVLVQSMVKLTCVMLLSNFTFDSIAFVNIQGNGYVALSVQDAIDNKATTTKLRLIGDVDLSRFAELSNLPHLESMELNYCNFDTLPDVILPKLKHFVSYSTNYADYRNFLSLQERLISVEIERSFLGKDELELESSLTSVRKLRLEYCNLLSIPKVVGYLNNLESLFLGNNEIKSIDLGIPQLNKLRILSIENNHLVSIPNELFRMSSIKKLNLSGNSLSEFPYIYDLMDDLVYLNLSNNSIDEIPQDIYQFRRLQSLNLSKNIIRTLPNMYLESLEEFYFEDNRLEEIPEFMYTMSNLRILNLSKNFITTIPNKFNSLDAIESIYLSNNKIIDISDSAFFIPSLKVVKLDGNELSSLLITLPVQNEISTMDFSDNRLVSIPEILNARSLEYLYVKNNELDSLNFLLLCNYVGLNRVFLGGNDKLGGEKLASYTCSEHGNKFEIIW